MFMDFLDALHSWMVNTLKFKEGIYLGVNADWFQLLHIQ